MLFRNKSLTESLDNFDDLISVKETEFNHLPGSHFDYRFIKAPLLEPFEVEVKLCEKYSHSAFASIIAVAKKDLLPSETLQGLVLRRKGKTSKIKNTYELYFVKDKKLVYDKPDLRYLHYWKFRRSRYCYRIWGFNAIEVTGNPTVTEMSEMIRLYSRSMRSFHGLLNGRMTIEIVTAIYSSDDPNWYIVSSDLDGKIDSLIPACEYLELTQTSKRCNP